MKCHHLINPNGFKTSPPAESPCFSKWLFPQQYCIQPFFPLSFPVWWNALSAAIYSLSTLFCHTLLSPAEEKLSEAARADPSSVGSLFAVVGGGMSNGSSAVLITSPHTCTPPCATHLIVPPVPPPLLQASISAYAPHSWIEALCPLVLWMYGIYRFATAGELGINISGLVGLGDAVVMVNWWGGSCSYRGQPWSSVILLCFALDMLKERSCDICLWFPGLTDPQCSGSKQAYLREKQWGGENIKQILREGVEEHWSVVHTEPDRQSQSEGHNKVHANRTMGPQCTCHEQARAVGVGALLALMHTLPFAYNHFPHISMQIKPISVSYERLLSNRRKLKHFPSDCAIPFDIKSNQNRALGWWRQF